MNRTEHNHPPHLVKCEEKVQILPDGRNPHSITHTTSEMHEDRNFRRLGVTVALVELECEGDVGLRKSTEDANYDLQGSDPRKWGTCCKTRSRQQVDQMQADGGGKQGI
jgi:hypothetical protein